LQDIEANDVWEELEGNTYGEGSMGEKLKKLKNPTFIIDNSIIV
jgi:hypothetical protein